MFISILAILTAGLLGILVAFFVFEVIAAIISRAPRPRGALNGRHPNVAVVVPAHNEGRNLIPTLLDLKAQLQTGDRLIVVADNCSDDTVMVAAEFGAEILERNDQTKIGKGYALDWAIQHLKNSHPDVVIFVDADCRIADGAIGELVDACTITFRPAQARYLMTAHPNSEISYQVAEFAWLTKNWVRPLGLRALGLPCQLMGTGMAFPWNVIRSANLASGEIVEDLKLGLDLALAGYPPQFCPSAAEGHGTQRQRWEKGHIVTIVSSAPRLLIKSLVSRNWGLLFLTLDLMIPPLSLFSLVLIGGLLIGTLIFIGEGSSAALLMSIANAIFFGLALIACWVKFGRDTLPAHAVPSIAYYVLGKLPLYKRIFTGRSVASWIRTDRDHVPPKAQRNHDPEK